MTEATVPPDQLTIEELDTLDDKYTIEMINDGKYHIPQKVLEAMEALAKTAGGYFYTQVDTDQGNRIYSRGLRTVNSTGIYVLMFSKENLWQGR